MTFESSIELMDFWIFLRTWNSYSRVEISVCSSEKIKAKVVGLSEYLIGSRFGVKEFSTRNHYIYWESIFPLTRHSAGIDQQNLSEQFWSGWIGPDWGESTNVGDQVRLHAMSTFSRKLLHQLVQDCVFGVPFGAEWSIQVLGHPEGAVAREQHGWGAALGGRRNSIELWQKSSHLQQVMTTQQFSDSHEVKGEEEEVGPWQCEGKPTWV